MDNDRMIASLAKLARQQAEDDQQPFDERWDALAAGELSAEEEAELAREAEHDPRMGLAYEAFRPLGAGFRDRMVEKISRQLNAERAASTPWPPTSRTVPPPPAEAVRGRSWQPWALAAALLATIGLTLLLPSPPGAVPEYAMSFDGMTRQERSAVTATTGEVLEFDAGNLFSLVLQPSTQVEEAVEASFFLAGQDELVAWTPHVEKAPSGAFKIEGRLGQGLELPPGDWQLIVVIAPASRAPDLDAVRGFLAGEEPATPWVVLRQPLRIRGG